MSKRQAEIVLNHSHRFLSNAASESVSNRDWVKRFESGGSARAASKRKWTVSLVSILGTLAACLGAGLSTPRTPQPQVPSTAPTVNPLAAQAKDLSPEVRRRVKALLEKLDGGPPSFKKLQAVGSIEILETIATPEARQLLHEPANGAAAARRTREAKASLERLAR